MDVRPGSSCDDRTPARDFARENADDAAGRRCGDKGRRIASIALEPEGVTSQRFDAILIRL